tara:strand:+ start:323 stop:607 length:285 start_codon:yes stop_codon:yes gene_type:complete
MSDITPHDLFATVRKMVHAMLENEYNRGQLDLFLEAEPNDPLMKESQREAMLAGEAGLATLDDTLKMICEGFEAFLEQGSVENSGPVVDPKDWN